MALSRSISIPTLIVSSSGRTFDGYRGIEKHLEDIHDVYEAGEANEN